MGNLLLKSSWVTLLQLLVTYLHRWALTPIPVISDIGLSLISERPISDWSAQSPTLYRILNKVLSNIRHKYYYTLMVQWYNARNFVWRSWVRDKYNKIVKIKILLGSHVNDFSSLDIGISDINLVRYRNGSWCQYRNSSDIGMRGFSPTYFVPISE